MLVNLSTFLTNPIQQILLTNRPLIQPKKVLTQKKSWRHWTIPNRSMEVASNSSSSLPILTFTMIDQKMLGPLIKYYLKTHLTKFKKQFLRENFATLLAMTSQYQNSQRPLNLLKITIQKNILIKLEAWLIQLIQLWLIIWKLHLSL